MRLFCKRFCIFAFVFTALTAFLPLSAQETTDADSDFNLPVVEKVLQNGLTVLILERPGVPVVSFSLMQPVGAQDAPKGKTGLPHMLEHMMFKGTETIGTLSYAKEKPILDEMDKVAQEINNENEKLQPSTERLKALADQMEKLEQEHHQVVVKDELSAIYTQNGGQSLNAWTSQDATNYTITLPANKFNLYATIEQDRLSHPVFREFYSERNVVAQERRWRTESNPEGKLSEALESTAFSASPYKDPAIGWMSDIMKLMRPDAEAFYHQTYRPDQGVLAIVGGVQAKDIIPILEKTLGQVPNPTVPPLKKNWTKEPPQEGQKTVHVYFDADPMVMMGWHMPNFPHADGLALDVLSDILTTGNTSRLIQRLLFGKKLVTSISTETGFPGDRSPNLFVLSFNPAPQHSADSIVSAIDAEIADIQNNGVTQAELDRARRNIESAFLWGKISTSDLAQDLAYNQAVHGDWRYVTRYMDMVRVLTPDDIKKVAAEYLTSENRTIAYLERPAK
jgi:predicted Zn-dependent peptidase